VTLSDVVLGQGNFGKVFKGTIIVDGKTREIAAKSLKSEFLEELEKEFAIMIQLQHPYIVRLYGKWKNERGEYFLISEFVNNGDLLTFLRESVLGRPSKISLMLQIVSGLKYLHSKKNNSSRCSCKKCFN